MNALNRDSLHSKAVLELTPQSKVPRQKFAEIVPIKNRHAGMLMTGGYKGEAALSLHDTASTAGSRALARIQGRNNSIIAKVRDRSPLAAGHQKTLNKR